MKRAPGRRIVSFGVVIVAVSVFSLLLAARKAEAYPQFQFASGTQRCAQCHFSPAGYGLLTTWGRDESADTISAYGGDGGFLHGLVPLPSFLALGGDLRYAAIENAVGGTRSPEAAVFPMQGELYARAALGSTGISIYATGGLRGVVRNANASTKDHLTAFVSREHYAMWKPSASGPYVRAGRFYAPYGLRLAEHIFFVRRYSGFNLYEETYNVSGGYLAEDWELHVTAFTPPPKSLPDALQSVGMRGSGGAVYAERRFASAALLGAQARVAINNEQRLIQGGLVGKLWLDAAKMLAMGELDLQRHDVTLTGGSGYNQSIGFLGLNFFPVKGLMAAAIYERYQEDIRLISTARSAFDLEVSLFPYAHIEVMLFGRYQFSGSGGADGDTGSLGLLQLHYYL